MGDCKINSNGPVPALFSSHSHMQNVESPIVENKACSIKELASFLNNLESSTEPKGLIEEYLKRSPDCLSLIQLLQSVTAPTHMATLYRVCGHILVHIAKGLDQWATVAIKLTDWILDNKADQLSFMLENCNISDGVYKPVCRALLFCFTGMVAQSSACAAKVLTSIKWSQVQFSDHVRRIPKNDSLNSRALYTFLVFAFLNHDDEAIIIQFVSIRGFLNSLFKGLQLDSLEIVEKFLHLLESKVVRNESISKMAKCSIFSSHKCSSLLSLYKYKEPGEKNADLLRRERVRTSIHKLLMVLFTDFNVGIVFPETKKDDKINIETYTNKQIYKILTEHESLWDTPGGRSLLMEVFSICPIMMKLYLKYLEPYLDKKMTDKDIEVLCKFGMSITAKTKPWINFEKNHKVDLDAEPIAGFNFVSRNFLAKAYESKSAVVKYEASRLFLAYLVKVRETVDHINESSTLADAIKDKIVSDLKHHCDRQDLVNNYLEQYYVFLCRGTMKTAEIRHSSGRLEKLLTVVEVYHVYLQLYPTSPLYERFISIVRDNMFILRQERLQSPTGYKMLLRNLLRIIETVSKCGYLDIHVISFIERSSLISGPESDHADKEERIDETTLFCSVVKLYHFFQDKTDAFEDVRSICLRILHDNLSKRGISTCQQEFLELWLFKMTDSNWGVPLVDLCNFFGAIVGKSVSDLGHYMDKLIEVRSSESEQCGNKDIVSLLETIDSFELDSAADVESIARAEPFSCLITAAFDLLRDSTYSKYVPYVSAVLCDYLHICKSPVLLSTYLIKSKVRLTPSCESYVRSWARKTSPSPKAKDVSNEIFVEEVPTLHNQLKNIFITGVHPKGPDALLEGFHPSYTEACTVLNQLTAYMSLESTTSESNKSRELKFYAKVFEKVIHKLLGQEGICSAKLLTFLAQHPTLISLYEPLSSTSKLSAAISSIISSAAASSGVSEDLVLPYKKIMIESVQSVNSIEITSSLDHINKTYIKTSILSSCDIEILLGICLKCLDDAPTRSFVVDLLGLLNNILDSSGQVSQCFTKFLLSKFIRFRKIQVSGIDKISQLMSVILIKIASNCNVNSISEKDFTKLLKIEPLPVELCCHILKLAPSYISLVIAHLQQEKIDLELHAALLVSISTECDQKIFKKFLKNVKPALKMWLEDESGKYCSNYQVLLDIGIDMGLWSIVEMEEICKLWYKTVTKRKEVPNHVVSLISCFKMLCGEPNGDVESPQQSWMVKAILFALAVLENTYGKNTLDEKSILCFTNLISLYVEGTNTEKLARKLIGSGIWPGFVKKSLKSGLKDIHIGSNLLNCLRTLTSKIYGTSATSLEPSLQSILQMLTSHSEYLNIMFSENQGQTLLKEFILRLLVFMFEFDQNLLDQKNIPILLGAYGGSMLTCDQLIFKLFMIFEQHKHLKFLPTVWGRSSLSFYSKKDDGVPSTDSKQILYLLDPKKVHKTALQFDVRLDLDPTIVPSTSYSEHVYDQRFLMFLFLSLTSGDADVDILDIAEKGGIALAVAALTSEREGVWKTGALLLRNCAEHFEKSRYLNMKQVWICSIYVLCYGLMGVQQRIPSLTANFAIKSMSFIDNASDAMFFPVINYFYLRSKFNLFRIPELYRFYFSQSIENHQHELVFLLKLLAMSVKTEMDMGMIRKEKVPPMVLVLIGSATNRWPICLEALKAIRAMVTITSGMRDFLFRHGLVTELHAFVSRFGTYDLHIESCLKVVVDIFILVVEYISSECSRSKADDITNNKRKLSLENTPNKRQKLAHGGGRSTSNTDEIEQNTTKSIPRKDILSADMTSVVLNLKISLKAVVHLTIQHLSHDYVEKILKLLEEFANVFQSLHTHSRERGRDDHEKWRHSVWLSPDMIVTSSSLWDEVKSWVDVERLCLRLSGHLDDSYRRLLLASGGCEVSSSSIEPSPAGVRPVFDNDQRESSERLVDSLRRFLKKA